MCGKLGGMKEEHGHTEPQYLDHREKMTGGWGKLLTIISLVNGDEMGRACSINR
jgi:hypothetical protein